jgi:hypothetical protein
MEQRTADADQSRQPFESYQCRCNSLALGRPSAIATGLPPGLSPAVEHGLITGTGTTIGVSNVTTTVPRVFHSPARVVTWTMTAPPAVTITGPTAAGTFSTTTSPIALSGTASDNVSVTQVSYKNNGGTAVTATGTTAWSVASVALVAGSNAIVVTARDAAGNTSTDTLTVTYTPPDTTAPTVSITVPRPRRRSRPVGHDRAERTASDNVGVTQVSYKNNGGAAVTATGTTAERRVGHADA